MNAVASFQLSSASHLAASCEISKIATEIALPIFRLIRTPLLSAARLEAVHLATSDNECSPEEIVAIPEPLVSPPVVQAIVPTVPADANIGRDQMRRGGDEFRFEAALPRQSAAHATICVHRHPYIYYPGSNNLPCFGGAALTASIAPNTSVGNMSAFRHGKC
jgi:hypothetical protein